VAADRAGFWGLGVPDSIPLINQGVYPTITACLLATRHIHIGPFVTNPVTRHWAVHATDARALDELAPGRFHLVLSPGDGAVRSIGLEPAKWSQVEDFVSHLEPHVPRSMPIFIAASGPKGAEVAGRVATDFVCSQGLDEKALDHSFARAQRARVEAGISTPLRKWMNTQLCVVPEGTDVKQVRTGLVGQACSSAHYRFGSTFEDKNVPAEWQAVIKDRFARYDYAFHGKGIGDNPNALLFEDHPEIADYIVDRTFVIGTVRQCVDRLGALRVRFQLDGIWISLLPNAFNPDPLEHLETIAPVLMTLEG
jgi:alkanesulfonate monooxygenase SsuD/methylene tetrahydromethanopterin reductase-like flavin-dependent oxidoreductase (luciferase family)